MKPLLN